MDLVIATMQDAQFCMQIAKELNAFPLAVGITQIVGGILVCFSSLLVGVLQIGLFFFSPPY